VNEEVVVIEGMASVVEFTIVVVIVTDEDPILELLIELPACAAHMNKRTLRNTGIIAYWFLMQ
jgi:hypothetical protein